MKAAMIGVGAIGRPMAERVLEAGIALRAYDVSPEAVAALVERGAVAATSPADAAAGCDVVACMVRNDAQVIDVALGAEGTDGALDAMAPGAVFVIQSTIEPETIRRLAPEARARGVALVDAPVTGGVSGATGGTLVVIAGGETADVDRCRPFLDAMSRKVVHCGAVGAGTVAKLCNNLVSYLSYLATFEANALATAAGIETDRLDEVLGTAGLLTANMQGYLTLARGGAGTPEQLAEMLPRITELAEKDLSHTLTAARELGVSLPGAAVCRDRMPAVYGLRPDES